MPLTGVFPNKEAFFAHHFKVLGDLASQLPLSAQHYLSYMKDLYLIARQSELTSELTERLRTSGHDIIAARAKRILERGVRVSGVQSATQE